VAGQIRSWGTPGLVLDNGEFGGRLAAHARGWGLPHVVVQAGWGEPLDLEAVEAAARSLPPGGWLWAVHCETSTGLDNDLPRLRALAGRHRLRLCLDAISSLGVMPVDLYGVELASGVSGKGLGGLPGVAMVFSRASVAPSPAGLPPYLDLGRYHEADGTPFTQSSNLLDALAAALRANDPAVDPEVGQRRLAQASRLRSRLCDLGCRLIGEGAPVSPAVITFGMPPGLSAPKIGRRLDAAGFLLSYRSDYLLTRNWMQIFLMGHCPDDKIAALERVLGDFLSVRP